MCKDIINTHHKDHTHFTQKQVVPDLNIPEPWPSRNEASIYQRKIYVAHLLWCLLSHWWQTMQQRLRIQWPIIFLKTSWRNFFYCTSTQVLPVLLQDIARSQGRICCMPNWLTPTSVPTTKIAVNPNTHWLPRSHTARASDNLLKNRGLWVKVEQAEKLARGYDATSVDH